jgi:protein-disulfide isomerase
MEGDVVKAELQNVRELAQRLEISGTPYLIIGDKAFPGAIPYAQIVEALK